MTSRIALLIAVAAAVLSIVPAALAEGRLAGSPEPVDAVAYFYANERATLANQSSDVIRRGDDFLRETPSTFPTSAVNTASDSEIEWAQLGIGVGVGILLAVGLWMAVRMSRRQLAH